jgi:hypothetical protein
MKINHLKNSSSSWEKPLVNRPSGQTRTSGAAGSRCDNGCHHWSSLLELNAQRNAPAATGRQAAGTLPMDLDAGSSIVLRRSDPTDQRLHHET